MNTYIVGWMWQGQRRSLDVDIENRAIAISVSLAELGRGDVSITEVPFAVDEEMKARMLETIRLRCRNGWADELAVFA